MSDKERIKKLAARLRGREDASALVSRAKKPLFSPEKVAERVPGDGWYAGGTDGVLGAVRHYLGNSDNYVRERLKAASEELPPEELSSVLMHEDAKRIYLGFPQLYGSLEPSPYRPTIGSSEAPYQVNALLTDTEFDNTILPMYSTWKTGEDWPLYDTKRRVSDLGKTAQLSDIPYLSNAGLSSGFDDRGQYISLYDVWDYNTGVMGKSGDNIGKYVGGKPFDIYQRYYLDDWLDVPQEARGNPYIAPSYIEADYTGPDVREYTSGGSIHIKPENRGKFTALKERTGHSATWFKEHGTPSQKKMAVFALNARKWNHGDGGFLRSYDMGGPVVDPEEERRSRISNTRYNMAYDALVRSGVPEADSARLAGFLGAQSLAEAGWVENTPSNNYAGYMLNGKKMKFDSPESFWDYHVKNLGEKWPLYKEAQTIEDYYNAINHAELGLDTPEKYKAYNKNHVGDEVYLYAPAWENTNYLGNLRSLYNKRVVPYIHSLNMRFGGSMNRYDGISKQSSQMTLLRKFEDGTPGVVVSDEKPTQTDYLYWQPKQEGIVSLFYNPSNSDSRNGTEEGTSSYPIASETVVQQRTLPSAEQLRSRLLATETGGETVPVQRDSFVGLPVPELALGKQRPIEVDLKKAPITIPQRDTASYFANTASKLVDEASKFNPRGLSRDEIISIQQELADEGYYSSLLAGMSKTEIKAVQEKLIQRGLLSNRKKADGSYAEADGIAGERTKAAWDAYNVDGKWGTRSDEAYKAKWKLANSSDKKWEQDFRNGVDGCARWVTQKYESVLGNISSQNGVVGNAWQMPKNIVRKGGTMLFNLYDEGFSGVKSVGNLVKKTRERLSEDKPDLSVLQPGDVVGIFFPGSTHHADVLKEGTTYNTHVGMVVGYDTDGAPIIQHNMGGKERKDRADRLPFSSSITVAARPATSGAIGTYPWQMGESKYEVELPEKFKKMATEESQANLKTYMDSMAGGADTIGRIYTNADMDAVQRIAIGVLGRETGFMQNTESSRTGRAGARVKVERLLRSIIRDENPETKSSDLSKFKLSNLSPNERAFLGIQSSQDLEKPEKAGLASMYVLAKNYDYFVRYAKENPQLGLTKQDIEDLTALSYNQGMGKLYSVGSVEFNGERRVAPSILESIREAAASDEVIDDFSATKLGRVAHEYPMLTGLMREMYKHGMGSRSSSYMNAARQAIQSIRNKNLLLEINKLLFNLNTYGNKKENDCTSD